MRATEVMEHLGRFAEDDPEEVATMTRDEINAALWAERVDIYALQIRLQARLDELRGIDSGSAAAVTAAVEERGTARGGG